MDQVLEGALWGIFIGDALGIYIKIQTNYSPIKIINNYFFSEITIESILRKNFTQKALSLKCIYSIISLF